jgi:hypothetical protein
MSKRVRQADNTSARSYFNFAESYWLSAKALIEAQIKGAPNRAYPIFFLYYHAIELYLKAYLRVQGLTVDHLQKGFGHDASKLSKQARKLGAPIKPKEMGLFDVVGKANAAILSRYQAGGYRLPPVSALERACKSLREIAGRAVEDAAGAPVPRLHRQRAKP